MKKEVLLIFALLLIEASEVFAETGNCGPKDENGNYTAGCIYAYDEINKTLTISGEGKMANFNYHDDETVRSDAPWRSLNYETITISEGITSVGNFAFIDSKVKNATLPETLTSIGQNAFHQSPLESINIPNSVTNIAYKALSLNRLTTVVLPENLKTIPSGMLYGTNINSLIVPPNVTFIHPNAFVSASETLGSPLETIYCPEHLLDQCAAAVSFRTNAGLKTDILSYEKTPNGQIFYNNKWYNSANDISSGNNIKKRIYSVEEAVKLSKPDKNTFTIRYK